jgi:hypothetical protein
MKVQLAEEWTLGEQIGGAGFGKVYAAKSDSDRDGVVKLVPKAPGAKRELLFADDLLIRRSGQVVQARPPVALTSVSIPQSSSCDGARPLPCSSIGSSGPRASPAISGSPPGAAVLSIGR